MDAGKRNGLVGLLVLLAASDALASDVLAVGGGASPACGCTVGDVMFYVFAAVAAISCLGVALTANIVRSAMWLLGVLGSVACLYFLMGANFLGAIQLIVYAGGILVLIVFGIMLTSKSPYIRMGPRCGEVLGGAVVGVVLFVVLCWVLLSGTWMAAGGGDVRVVPVAELGKELLTTYLVPFEVTSVLLLVVMIGAAYLVRAEK